MREEVARCRSEHLSNITVETPTRRRKAAEMIAAGHGVDLVRQIETDRLNQQSPDRASMPADAHRLGRFSLRSVRTAFKAASTSRRSADAAISR
jgi:hypothetical protein